MKIGLWSQERIGPWPPRVWVRPSLLPPATFPTTPQRPPCCVTANRAGLPSGAWAFCSFSRNIPPLYHNCLLCISIRTLHKLRCLGVNFSWPAYMKGIPINFHLVWFIVLQIIDILKIQLLPNVLFSLGEKKSHCRMCFCHSFLYIAPITEPTSISHSNICWMNRKEKCYY